MAEFTTTFDQNTLDALFPPERSNEFFDALFGDAEEGAYDIRLRFQGHDAAKGQLLFFLDLIQRPGACLACNLTFGLPEVFSRHPIINIKGLVEAIAETLPADTACDGWRLGTTIQQSKELHSIPLVIDLKAA
jgi:hypothetical protein